eukprot:359687-Chlamydomonas_euryale.AAC.6
MDRKKTPPEKGLSAGPTVRCTRAWGACMLTVHVERPDPCRVWLACSARHRRRLHAALKSAPHVPCMFSALNVARHHMQRALCVSACLATSHVP